MNNSSELNNLRIGFALTGSFCTFDTALACMEELVNMGAKVTPIISAAVDTMDTKFYKTADLKEKLMQISGNNIIRTITEAEPIGPQKLFDLLIVLPATGNTIAKLAYGITDTTVTMAVKSHLRNNRPVVLGISSNDALGNSAKNIGMLMNYKHIYFVPYAQDDPVNKPKSMVFIKDLTIPAIKEALDNRQLQPVVM
jgi:dipicolinate synthase subunit B